MKDDKHPGEMTHDEVGGIMFGDENVEWDVETLLTRIFYDLA